MDVPILDFLILKSTGCPAFFIYQIQGFSRTDIENSKYSFLHYNFMIQEFKPNVSDSLGTYLSLYLTV